MKSPPNNIRFDLKIIAAWIEPGSRVISLGCGEGDLLHYLKQNNQIIGTGIDHDEAKVARGIERGLSILQGDINTEVLDYSDDFFDYVILSQTLQQIYEPAKLIQTMLRIGKKGVVSFPNFSQWRIRRQLLMSGYAPITPELPYEWYDTPNIRVITLKDFRKFAREVDFKILKEVAINTDSHAKKGTIVKTWANLRASYGIFLIGK